VCSPIEQNLPGRTSQSPRAAAERPTNSAPSCSTGCKGHAPEVQSDVDQQCCNARHALRMHVMARVSHFTNYLAIICCTAVGLQSLCCSRPGTSKVQPSPQTACCDQAQAHMRCRPHICQVCWQPHSPEPALQHRPLTVLVSVTPFRWYPCHLASHVCMLCRCA
jgi:hypothetical protein